jgi:hypothetical protein
LIYAKYATQVDDWKLALLKLSSIDYDYDFRIAIDSITGRPLNGNLSSHLNLSLKTFLNKLIFFFL